MKSLINKFGRSFFDEHYQTPQWLIEKKITAQVSRRQILKSAAGALVVSTLPPIAWSNSLATQFEKAILSQPWLTLDAVLSHLLPESATGPSAKAIKATQYLFAVIHQQPTAKEEITFIFKGVGWLNDFSSSQKNRKFITLSDEEKEEVLRDISRSRAGENWLSHLISYLFEAMLAPPSYGGNPKGIGWQWLEHQAGFPLPKEGQRYYELPLTVQESNSKQKQLAAIQKQASNTVGTRKA